MMGQPRRVNYLLLLVLFCACNWLACTRSNNQSALFDLLESNSTGLSFSNTLTPTDSLNLFSYMYFYNGAGVGAGDFNNDGLTDVFFASNQVQNKIFLNSGDLKFKDKTAEANIPKDSGWSTGVSIVDINNDGLLDIYVCRVSEFKGLRGKNQLLICRGIGKDGVPTYADSAHKYGLDFAGFSTQAAFFDYDLDGDLDMYLLNHAVHQNGNYGMRSTYSGQYDSLSGDRIFNNKGGFFTYVTGTTGINSSSIGYGLGINISDINVDGYPDVFIGNDFK